MTDDWKLPVPNDRPDCKCTLETGDAWKPFTLTVVTYGEDGQDLTTTVAYDPACPYHGGIIRAMPPKPGSFSIAPREEGQ